MLTLWEQCARPQTILSLPKDNFAINSQYGTESNRTDFVFFPQVNFNEHEPNFFSRKNAKSDIFD